MSPLHLLVKNGGWSNEECFVFSEGRAKSNNCLLRSVPRLPSRDSLINSLKKIFFKYSLFTLPGVFSEMLLHHSHKYKQKSGALATSWSHDDKSERRSLYSKLWLISKNKTKSASPEMPQGGAKAHKSSALAPSSGKRSHTFLLDIRPVQEACKLLPLTSTQCLDTRLSQDDTKAPLLYETVFCRNLVASQKDHQKKNPKKIAHTWGETLHVMSLWSQNFPKSSCFKDGTAPRPALMTASVFNVAAAGTTTTRRRRRGKRRRAAQVTLQACSSFFFSDIRFFLAASISQKGSTLTADLA